jgi:hypothetical protein
MIASAVKTFFCCLLLFLLVSIVYAQAPHIGDPGWTFDESRFDPRFPAELIGEDRFSLTDIALECGFDSGL